MKFLKCFLFGLLVIQLNSCKQHSTEPIIFSTSDAINISGALSSSFDSTNTEYFCQAAIKSWNIGNTLILSIRAKSKNNNSDEQISLNLYFPLDSDDYPVVGKYYSHMLADEFCGVTYKNQWDQNSFSKYRFETGLARMVIEKSDNNHLIGKFSLSANQSYGQCILDGQVEDIKLTNQGKITVSGKIDVELDT